MFSKKDKLMVMKEGKVSSALLQLGIPTMVGMIVSALYSVVDAYFVGALGESQMGSISVVFPIVQLVVGLGLMFGGGAGACISRFLGEGKNDKASITASTALFTSLVVGILSILCCLGFLDNLLKALGATETMLPYAREYALSDSFTPFAHILTAIEKPAKGVELTILSFPEGCTNFSFKLESEDIIWRTDTTQNTFLYSFSACFQRSKGSGDLSA